jgi:hypothetical protein
MNSKRLLKNVMSEAETRKKWANWVSQGWAVFAQLAKSGVYTR